MQNYDRSGQLSEERVIDQIVIECNRRMPLEIAKATTAMYARSSTNYPNSVADQVSSMCKIAERERLFVARELVFTDFASSGTSDRRPGLVALETALRAGEAEIVIVERTSRLFRRTKLAFKFIGEAVARGARFICPL